MPVAATCCGSMSASAGNIFTGLPPVGVVNTPARLAIVCNKLVLLPYRKSIAP